MIRRLMHEIAGAAAVEFAFVAPVLVALMTTGVALALTIWTENILQDAAQEAARCVAIGSSACAAVSTGCDSASPAVCYAETVALNRGMTSMAASNVFVNTSLSSGGVTFTSITLKYTYSLSGYSYTVVGQGSFPNAS